MSNINLANYICEFSITLPCTLIIGWFVCILFILGVFLCYSSYKYLLLVFIYIDFYFTEFNIFMQSRSYKSFSFMVSELLHFV